MAVTSTAMTGTVNPFAGWYDTSPPQLMHCVMRSEHGGLSGFGNGNDHTRSLDSFGQLRWHRRQCSSSCGWKGAVWPLRLPDVKPPCFTLPPVLYRGLLFAALLSHRDHAALSLRARQFVTELLQSRLSPTFATQPRFGEFCCLRPSVSP